MRALSAALGLALLIALFGSGRAALDVDARSAGTELLIFEHPDCGYCRLLRRDVLARYAQSSHPGDMTVRFIDIQKTETDGLPLRTRLEILPTAVVVKDGEEIDRISGYWGPDNFFRMLAHILAKAE
jgi:thioredoxin-related protein